MITASLVLYNQKFDDISKLVKVICDVVDWLIIVDNSAVSMEDVFKNKNIKYYSNPKNLGFGKGHNVAFREAIKLGSNFHFIVNPDIEIERKVIKKLSRFLEDNTDIVAIMPKIVYRDGKLQNLCKRYPTPFDLIFRRFIPTRVKKYLRASYNYYECQDLNLEDILEIPLLSGCFVGFRTSAINEVGGFDPRYFMYLEDFDLFRKLKLVGKIIYYPKLTVMHGFEKGSYKNPLLLKYHIISAVRYFNKWGWFYDKDRKITNKNAGKKYIIS